MCCFLLVHLKYTSSFYSCKWFVGYLLDTLGAEDKVLERLRKIPILKEAVRMSLHDPAQ